MIAAVLSKKSYLAKAGNLSGDYGMIITIFSVKEAIDNLSRVTK